VLSTPGGRENVTKFWRLGPKIYSVVILLSAFTAGVGIVAITGFQTYNAKVREIDQASTRAVISERVNTMLYAVVMDSRGIYMARDTAESEKYAPLVIQNLRKIEALMEGMDEPHPARGQGDDGAGQRPCRRVRPLSQRARPPVA
jgi:hypothetical protein